MALNPKSLKDDTARLTAISAHDCSMLVEAGAGSGKTAVMAGRIALMLAEGTPARTIAAVTFTELAASELLSRVREFVQDLIVGNVAAELSIAFPNGLSDKQLANLLVAQAAIDEITCSTIHGFCQRLIKPYPAEADIDPGAGIIDRNQGDLAFAEIVETWLREQLGSTSGSLLAEMVLQDAEATVRLVHTIANALRHRRDLRAPTAPAAAPALAEFEVAVKTLADFVRGCTVSEPETEAIVHELSVLLSASRPSGDLIIAELVWMLAAPLSLAVLTKEGKFRAYKKKGKWEAAAKKLGLSKTDAAQLNQSATDCYVTCAERWRMLKEAAAAHALALLIDQTREVVIRYRDYKRRSALLDFDDLIYAARDLLRNHEVVRKALGKRYAHVLVDEFQDTDPLQTEIFWRLCGDPPSADSSWIDYRIRPGALFLVGDPKQAIYRFRGADVRAYVEARAAFQAQEAQGLLSISTNFRSRRSILTYVNTRFEAVLSADGQPGFTALDAFHEDVGEAPAVIALDVKAADEEGSASAEQMRDAEAEAVAELCARLIGYHAVIDRRTGEPRPCRPGDIALLAPTGTELWRYEEALESLGIPVATQAGKGFFRRQEIQDLIALTRVLADRRDTLALGALLRGPVVGLTDEELADLIWALPRFPDRPDVIPKLTVQVDVEHVAHPLARDVLEKLQVLYKRSNNTTPHELLSLAVDVLRVRPILLERHRGQAERALANVDLYLSLAGGYAVRGLQAFAEAMRTAWEDQERSVEGRPDAQEESIALFTIHASKGLEWPVVIPINTMTAVKGASSAVIDRNTGAFYCPILGVTPAGFEEAIESENVELARERLRLWYVAATRARELLVLPRLDVAGRSTTWGSLLDFGLDALPAIDPAQLPAPSRSPIVTAPNTQTRQSFATEADAIVAGQPKLSWRTPSRHEGAAAAAVEKEEADIWTSVAGEPGPDLQPPSAVQGGRERGLILHKLMEEILSGELAEALAAVTVRAGELIGALGQVPVADPENGLSSEELAGCVARTLALPQVAALRPKLQAEFAIYGSRVVEEEEQATSGIADALTIADGGQPDIVIDWKSDVAPTQETLDLYCKQVGAYLDVTSAREGLIVLMTSGVVIPVRPTA